MSRWYEGLNQEQEEAVRHNHGPLLILAGAGSGKTTVLVARAGRLIDEGVVPANRLVVLTFTNKAARELKHRVAAKLGDRAKGLWAGTFHSFGLFLLRRFHKEAGLPRGFGVLDPTDAGALVKELLKDLAIGDKTAYDADRILSMLSEWREQGRANATGEDEYEEAVEWLLPKYEARLGALGMVDFDQLILKPVQLMKQNPELKAKIESLFDQVMVDEFQDTNKGQMDLIRALVQSHRNIAVVGDDDQSIYGWRGACVRNILDFPKLYSQCRVVRLERNYRSSPAILELANHVIAKNKERHSKVLKPEGKKSGELPEAFTFENEDEEAEGVATEITRLCRVGTPRRDIAVLYRSNGQGALLEAELRKHQIPYRMSGGTAFFDRKEVRDVLAYLRTSLRPNEVSLRRILNTPSRGIGDRSIELITQYASSRGMAFVTATQQWQSSGLDAKIGAALDGLWEQLRNLPPLLLSPLEASPGTALLGFLTRIGYRGYLDRTSPNALAGTKRWKCLEIFAGILDKFVQRGGKKKESLTDFLDAMELRDDGEEEEVKDEVQLLTLHACKGLEFPVVFFIGVEEDLIPNKTLGADLAEERRLFYVGVTRAKSRLIFTRARNRRRHGKTVPSAPSRFLLEIPNHLLQKHEGPRPLNESERRQMISELFRKIDGAAPGPTPTN